MAKLSSTDKPVTKAELAEFYQQIFPYLGGNKAVDSNPVGHFGFFLLPSAPAGYLACEGQRLSATAFPLLFNALKEFPAATRATWGAGDADWVTEFDLPDMRGEFVRASGTNAHTNQGNGANVGVHQDATEVSSSFRHENSLIHPIYSMTGNNGVRNQDKINDMAGFINVSGTYAESGGSSSGGMYAVRPTNTSLLGCVKYTYVTQEVEYSPEERVVGVWKETVDGVLKQKPLYQKTIIKSSMSATDGDVFDVSFSQALTKVTNAEGSYLYGSNSANALRRFWNYGYIPSKEVTNKIEPMVFQHPNGLAYASDVVVYDVNITVQYTKTTDQWQTV